MTDTNRDGKIDANEFERMLYAEDIAKLAAAGRPDEEDIQVVEEVSNESDDEAAGGKDDGDEDAEIRAEIEAGMMANRARVMTAKKQAAAHQASSSAAAATAMS